MHHYSKKYSGRPLRSCAANIMLLSLFQIILSSTFSYCRITRLPCKVYANFDVHSKDLAATTTKLATFAGKTRRECVLACVSNPSCKSANHNADTRACELMAVDSVDGFQSLAIKAGWTFVTTTDQV